MYMVQIHFVADEYQVKRYNSLDKYQRREIRWKLTRLFDELMQPHIKDINELKERNELLEQLATLKKLFEKNQDISSPAISPATIQSVMQETERRIQTVAQDPQRAGVVISRTAQQEPTRRIVVASGSRI